MPKMSVPKEVLAGLKIVADLNPSARKAIIDTLRSESASLNPLQAADALAANVDGLDKSKARSVLDSVIALEFARASNDVSVSRLVGDVIGSLGLDLDQSNRDDLSSWLTESLGIDALLLSAKGISVMQDNEKSFLAARIITNIRPVYKEDLSEMPKTPPSAAVVVHTLKLAYRESGDYKEFFVTLDADDIATLKKVLDRAEAKFGTLKSLLESAKVAHLGANDEASK
jgi:hypothetical protein